jgi:Secretion system C-terminal sorting domain
VYGNFDVVSQLATITFPSTGIWYNYLGDGTRTISSLTFTVNLQPGEYYVYTNKDIKNFVLPLSWISFSAVKSGSKSISLSWLVANETNNNHFEIERSADGINFTSIGKTESSKSTQTQHRYSFTDNLPLSSSNYYRIKQVDNDGKYSYSSVEKIDMNDVARYWKIYPNPAQSHSGFYANGSLSKVDLSVTDMNGKQVWHTTASNVNAGQRIDIDLSNAGKGIYMLKINTDKGSSTEKIIVE